MRSPVFLITLALAFSPGSKISAQELDTVITISWTPKRIPHKDSIVRPSNVASHAYLAESDQDHFKLYMWMEYGGLVDSINNIHKILMYDWEGKDKSEEYYMLIDGDPTARVRLNDYKIGSPFGKIKKLSSRGVSILLYLVNYKDSELNYADVRCYAADKENYTLVSSFSNNTIRNAPSPISEEYEVYIKVEKQQGNLFSLVIQDYLGRVTRRDYKLVSNQNQDFKGDKLPFFYYHLDSKRICLLNGMYLDPI